MKAPENKLLLFLLTGGIFCSAMAQAAVITNLSSSPQLVEVASSGGDFHTVTIAPNETWRTPGKIVARYRQQTARMEENEEYAIWPDGSFGPQKRELRGGAGIDLR